MGTTIGRTLVLFLSIPLFGQLLSVPEVSAVEFVIVGPRAMGMGGAGVAATTDALASYWNPAGLATTQGSDLRIQASGQGVDRLGLRDTFNEIDRIDRTNPASAARLQTLLDRVNTSSISAHAAGGIYFKGYGGSHALGLNVSDVATGGLFTPTPLTVITGPLLNVDGQIQVQLLEARQVALSYAQQFFHGTLIIGGTAKLIQGAAYNKLVAVFGAENDFNFTSDLGRANISTEFGVDVGAIVRPTSWIRLAVVGKDLNEPTFHTPLGGQYRLVPQVRAGVAINPYESLTIAFDGDITKNPTLLPNLKSRVLSLGAEHTMFSEFLSLRVGVLKNVEDAKTIVTPTAGIGIKFFALKFDAGGGYDFREGGALVSVSLSMTF